MMEHTISQLDKEKEYQLEEEKTPLYVLKTDVKENIVYVGEGSDHPGLFRSGLKVSKKKIHFINDDKGILKNDNLKARIRYRQALQKVSVIEEKIFYHFIFQIPQKSITSGQFIAIYLNDELICSGIIHWKY